MQALKKCVSGLLVLSVLGLFLPNSSSCGGVPLFTKAGKKTITKHEPIINSAPEQDIPMVAPDSGGQTGSRKYLWMGLGAAALIGLIAAVIGGGGGGGGDGGCSGPDCENTDQGDISASW